MSAMTTGSAEQQLALSNNLIPDQVDLDRSSQQTIRN